MIAPPRIMLVTDPSFGDDLIVRVVEACAAALPEGALAVQLRDKSRELVSLRMFASRLRVLTKRFGARLLINGNAQLARDIGADGVHLGGSSMRVTEARALCGDAAFISIAAHSLEALRGGIRDGANAALVSPIFESPGKGQGRGLEALRSACALAPHELAIYALGGVDATNARMCVEAGARGVAVIRALLLAKDPAAEARALFTHISEGVRISEGARRG